MKMSLCTTENSDIECVGVQLKETVSARLSIMIETLQELSCQ